jgi:hypothetical protein
MGYINEQKAKENLFDEIKEAFKNTDHLIAMATRNGEVDSRVEFYSGEYYLFSIDINYFTYEYIMHHLDYYLRIKVHENLVPIQNIQHILRATFRKKRIADAFKEE